MDPDFPIAFDKKHPTCIRSTDSTALLPRLRLGDVFGELSLLYDEPRSAGSQWDLNKTADSAEWWMAAAFCLIVGWDMLG